jgi:hypothetical protein
LVSIEQLEKQEEIGDYGTNRKEWVESICSRVRDVSLFIYDSDRLPSEEDTDTEELWKYLKNLGVSDIRTISIDEDRHRLGSFSSRWGLVLLHPITIPDNLDPKGYDIPSADILDMFEDYAAGSVSYRRSYEHGYAGKIRREVFRISSGKGFNGEQIRRFFVMSCPASDEISKELLCLFTVCFDQRKALYDFVKMTEQNALKDPFRPWYMRK